MNSDNCQPVLHYRELGEVELVGAPREAYANLVIGELASFKVPMVGGGYCEFKGYVYSFGPQSITIRLKSYERVDP